MKLFAASLLLLASLTPPLVGASIPDVRPAPITVAYTARNRLAPAVLAEVQEELADILALPGAPPDWKEVKTVQRHGVSNRLVVVTFKGVCSPWMAPPWIRPLGILGDSAVVDGAVLPFVTIDCDRVRSLLGDALGSPKPKSTRLLGRALGRVLAHEVYHILAGTTRHTDTGVAKARFEPADLTADNLEFDQDAQAAIANHFHYASAAGSPDLAGPSAP